MRGRFSADRMSQKPVRTLVVRLAMKRVATVFSIMFFKKGGQTGISRRNEISTAKCYHSLLTKKKPRPNNNFHGQIHFHGQMGMKFMNFTVFTFFCFWAFVAVGCGGHEKETTPLNQFWQMVFMY